MITVRGWLPIHELGDNERSDQLPDMFRVGLRAPRLTVGEPVERLAVLAITSRLPIRAVWVGFYDGMSLDEEVEDGKTGRFPLPPGISFVVEVQIGRSEGHAGSIFCELIRVAVDRSGPEGCRWTCVPRAGLERSKERRRINQRVGRQRRRWRSCGEDMCGRRKRRMG